MGGEGGGSRSFRNLKIRNSTQLGNKMSNHHQHHEHSGSLQDVLEVWDAQDVHGFVFLYNLFCGPDQARGRAATSPPRQRGVGLWVAAASWARAMAGGVQQWGHQAQGAGRISQQALLCMPTANDAACMFQLCWPLAAEDPRQPGKGEVVHVTVDFVR